MSLTTYVPPSYRNRYVGSDTFPSYIQTKNRMDAEQDRYEKSMYRALKLQEAMIQAEENDTDEDFLQYYKQRAPGRLPTGERVTRLQEVFQPVSDLDEYISQQADMTNTRALLGMNAMGHQARYAGTEQYLEQVEYLLPAEMKRDIGEFRLAINKGMGGTESGDYSVASGVAGIVTGWFTDDLGTNSFVTGGRVDQMVFDVDQRWRRNTKLQDAVVEQLLSPNSPYSRIFQNIRLTDEDIRQAPSIPGLVTMINARVVDYKAGLAAANQSGFDKALQFTYDLGRGILSDPDTVVEAGVTLLAMPFTLGGSGVAFLGRQGAKLTVKAGAKVSGKIAVRSRRIANATEGMFELAAYVPQGLDVLGRATTKISRIPQKFLLVNLFDELIAPAIKNYKVLKNGKLGDEVADAAAEAIKDNVSKDSILWASIRRALTDDSVGDISKRYRLLSAGADGFVGELVAYAVSLDDIYSFQRLAYGDDIDSEDFKFNFMNALYSGGMGAVFGGAFNLGLKAVGGSLANVDAVKKILSEPLDADMTFSKLWSKIGETRKKIKLDQTRKNVLNWLADVSGLNASETAKLNLKGLAKARGASEATLRSIDQLVDLAFSKGIDLHKLVKLKMSDTKQLAAYIRKNGNTTKAKQRQAALNGLRKALNSDDPKIVEYAETVSKLATELNRRRIIKSTDGDILPSEVNAFELLKEIADDPEAEPELREKATTVINDLSKAMVNRRKFIAQALTNIQVTDFDPDMALDIVNTALESHGFEKLSREDYVKIVKFADEARAKLTEKRANWEAAKNAVNSMPEQEVIARWAAFSKTFESKPENERTIKEKAYYYALKARVELIRKATTQVPKTPETPVTADPKVVSRGKKRLRASLKKLTKLLYEDDVKYHALHSEAERAKTRLNDIDPELEPELYKQVEALVVEAEAMLESVGYDSFADEHAVGKPYVPGLVNVDVESHVEISYQDALNLGYTPEQIRKMPQSGRGIILRLIDAGGKYQDGVKDGKPTFSEKKSKVEVGTVIPETIPLDADELDGLNMPQLRQFAADNGLTSKGNKTEVLRTRLKEEIEARNAAIEPVEPKVDSETRNEAVDPETVKDPSESLNEFVEQQVAEAGLVVENPDAVVEAPSEAEAVPAREATIVQTEGMFGLDALISEELREGWKKLANKIAGMTRGLLIIPAASRTTGMAVNPADPTTIQISEGGQAAIDSRGGDDVALRVVVSEEVAHAASYVVLGDDYETVFSELWNSLDDETKALIENAYFPQDRKTTFKTLADDNAKLNASAGVKVESDEGASQGGSEVFRMLMQYRMGIPLTETLRQTSRSTGKVETDAEYQERVGNLMETVERLNNSLTEAQRNSLDAAVKEFAALMPPTKTEKSAAPKEGEAPASEPSPTEDMSGFLSRFKDLSDADQRGFLEIGEEDGVPLDENGDLAVAAPTDNVFAEAIEGETSQITEANNTFDATGIEAITNEANQPSQAEANIQRNVVNAVVDRIRSVKGKVGTFEENDARNPDATFTPAEMAKRTAENLDKFKDRINGEELAQINEEIDKTLESRSTEKEVAALIYDEFGIDVGLKRGEGKQGVSVLPIEGQASGPGSAKINTDTLKNLYRSMKILQEIPSVAEEVAHQGKLARELAAGIRSLGITVKAQGLDERYIPYSLVVRYIPKELVDGIYAIFRDAQTIDNQGDVSVFDLDIMLRIAYERLSRADESFAMLVRVKEEKKRSREDKNTTKGRIRNRLLQSDLASANKSTFETAAANGDQIAVEADAIDHTARVQLAAERHSNGDMQAHVNKHKALAVRGLIEGWSKIPAGPTKELLAKKLGVAGLVEQNKSLFDLNRNDPTLRSARAQFYLAVEKYIADELDDPEFTLQALMDGRIDSAAGYHVGRAAIEAIDGTRYIGREWGRAWDSEASIKVSETSDANPIARHGYIGTMDSKTLASLHEDHVKERVSNYLLYEDEDMTTLRRLDSAQIEEILDYYDAIEEAIEAGERSNWAGDSWEKFQSFYLQDTFYVPDTKRQYAPDVMIRDIREHIANFREQVERRVKAMRSSPPSIVKTLHDDVTTIQTFFGSMYIIGQVPGAPSNIRGGVPATVGMPFGQAVPGSFAQAWNIRAENMFPTLKGISRISTLAGLTSLGSFIDSLGENKLKFLKIMRDVEVLEFKLDDNGKILDVENTADASSQAVTFAQMINIDYLRSKENGDLERSQTNFLDFLESVKTRLKENWGGDELLEDLETYGDSLDAKGDDNYSKVGLKALRDAPEGSTLRMLYVAFLNQISPEEVKALGSSENITSLNEGDTPLGKALRKEVFKPPVMTLPYSAGIPAFRNSIKGALTEIKENPVRYGISEEVANRINPEKAADELAVILYGEKDEPGLIEEVLQIPNSTQLQKLMVERGLTRVNELLSEDGADFRIKITENDLLDSEVLTNPLFRSHLKKLAKRYLLMPDTTDPLVLEDSGIFVLKQLFEVQKGNLSWKAFLKTCQDLAKYQALDPAERHRWRTVSSYIATAEHTGRQGYIAVDTQIRAAMDQLGIDESMLTPEALTALRTEIAHYFPKSTQVGGRVNSELDGRHATQAMSSERVSKETIGQGDIQLGQYRLGNGHEGIFGLNISELEGEEYENALRSAVVLDMMMEASSIFKPPLLDGSNTFVSPSLGDFIFESGSEQNRGARLSMSKIAQTIDEEISKFELKAAELRKEGKTLDKKEQQKWAYLQEMRSILVQRDPDTGRINSVRNRTWIAADIQAVRRIDRPSSDDFGTDETRTAPTKVGIPFLRHARETIHSKPRAQQDVLAGQAPFSIYELNVASPINPEYTQRVIEEGEPPVIDNLDNEVFADEIVDDYSEAEIQAQIKAEEEAAAAQTDETVKGQRAVRLTQRMKASMRGAVKRVVTRDGHTPSQHTAVLKDNLRKAREGLIATFGGTSREDAAQRGEVSKFDLPRRGAAKGRRREQSQRQTVLGSLQVYGMYNRIKNMVGLALGAVPYANVRLLNPNIDSREAKAQGANFQKTNRVTSPTSRGPMSIFFRDWTLMGGSHLDTVKTMLRYVYEKGTDLDGNKFESFQDAVDYVVKRGIFTVWSETVLPDNDARMDDQALMDLALFAEETRNDYLYQYNMDDSDLAAIEKQFDQKFNEALVIHGLDTRITTVLNGEEKVVFLEMLTELQDPKKLTWLRDVLDLDESYTPEKIAVLFMEPKSKENLFMLPVYELERDEKGNEVPVYTKWGQVINGMTVSDVKMASTALPVWTELEILNLANLSGNRELVRKIMLANRFGIDIDIELTNSQRLDTNVDKFANNRIQYHGFLVNPRNDETSVGLIEGAKDPKGRGYSPSEHGVSVIRGLREILGPDDSPRAPDAAYGAAALLRSMGFIYRKPNGGEEANAPTELIREVMDMIGLSKMKTAQVLAASRHIGKALFTVMKQNETANAVKDSVETTERVINQISMTEANQRLQDIQEGAGELVVDGPPQDDFATVPDYPDVVQHVAQSPVDEQHKPLPMAAGVTAYGNTYLNSLKERDGVEFQNLAKMFVALTARGGQEEALSDADAIALLEFAMVNERVRKALFGGGEIQIGHGDEVSIDLSFDKEKVNATLNGFNKIKKAMQEDNLPFAAYLLIHELVERTLMIRRAGERQVPQKGPEGATTNKLKILAFRELLDETGRNNFMKALEAIGFPKEDIKKLRALFVGKRGGKGFVAARIDNDFRRRFGIKTNNIRDFPDKAITELVNGMEISVADRGVNPPGDTFGILQEAMAHYVTFVIFKRNAMEQMEAPAIVNSVDIAKVARDILNTLHTIMTGITRLTPFKKGEPGLAARQAQRKSEFKGVKQEPSSFMAETRSDQFVDYDGAAWKEHLSFVDKVLDQAIEVMDGIEVEDEASPKAFRYRESVTFRRNATGTSDLVPETELVKRLAEVEDELRRASPRTNDYMKLIAERDTLRANLTGNKEVIGYDGQREAELLIKARGAANPISGEKLVNMRNLSDAEQEELKSLITFRVLGEIRTQRTNAVGRVLTTMATFGSAAEGGMVKVRGSSFHAIRALGAMLNPEGVNTEVALRGYIPAQVSQDFLEIRLSNTRRALNRFNIYMTKRAKKDNAGTQNLHAEIRIALENSGIKDHELSDPDVLKQHLESLDLPAKIVRDLIMFRNLWFGEKGYLKEFVTIAELDGLISPKQAADLRRRPRLPFMVDRDYLDVAENFESAKEDVRRMVLQNQLNEFNKEDGSDPSFIHIDLLEDVGLLWEKGKSEADKGFELSNQAEVFKRIWLDEDNGIVALFLEDGPLNSYLPENWDTFSDIDKVDWLQDTFKTMLVRPKDFTVIVKDPETGAEGEDFFRIMQARGVNPGVTDLFRVFQRQLEAEKPLSWCYARDQKGNPIVERTPAARKLESFRDDQRRRGVTNVRSTNNIADPGIGGAMATRIVMSWKNGGSLKLDEPLFTDPRYLRGSKDKEFEWLNFQVNSISALTNSLFGGRLSESNHNVVNYGVFGINGFGVRDIIISLREMLSTDDTAFLPGEDGKPVPLSKVEQAQALKDLEGLMDQYDVGLNKKPQGVAELESTNKLLHILSRFGVTLASAENWTVSALAETMHMFGDTLRRIITQGEFKAFADFFTALTPEAKLKEMDSLNLSTYYINRHNIGVRTGMFYLDDLVENEFRDTSSSRFKTDGLVAMSNAENTLRRFATLGFGKVNRYNRVVQAKRAIRDLQRIVAKGEDFDTFINFSKKMDQKQIRTAARKLGMRAEQGTHLAAHAGLFDPEFFRLVVREFVTRDGLDQAKLAAAVDKYMVSGQYDKARRLKEASHQVIGFLQFVNTNINLEPKMLTRGIPKDIKSELFATLTQFPALALHQTKTMFRMGGYGGLTMWLLSFLLGETFYSEMREMVRGKSWAEIMEAWSTDPVGKGLKVAEKLPFMGNFAIFQEIAAYNAVRIMREIAQNPDFLKGYDSNPRATSFGIAGLSMLQQNLMKLFRTMNGVISGDMTQEEAARNAYELAPIPFSQLSTLALNAYYPESGFPTNPRSQTGGYHTSSRVNSNYYSKSKAQERAMRLQEAREQPTESLETPEGIEVSPAPTEPLEAPERQIEDTERKPDTQDIPTGLDQLEGQSSKVADQINEIE